MLPGFNFEAAQVNRALDAVFLAQVIPPILYFLVSVLAVGAATLQLARPADRAIRYAFWHGVCAIILFQLVVLLTWLYYVKGMYLSSLVVAMPTLIVSKIELCFFLGAFEARSQHLRYRR